MSTMDLHGDLADTQFSRDLLVHQTSRDEGYYLPLARSQRVMQDSQVRNHLLVVASFLISLERLSHSIQYVLVPEGLGQEINGSGFHRLDRHRDVAMTRHEDDRNANTCLGQFGLKVEAADTRQPDVQD